MFGNDIKVGDGIMTLYEAWCRPHGRPDLPTTLAFLVESIDHRAAWQSAMNLCFRGGRAETLDAEQVDLAPVHWTVRKIKLHESEASGGAHAEAEDDWPRPASDVACPAAREAALDRLYGDRAYDSYRIRPSRTTLNFCARGRPVNVAA